MPGAASSLPSKPLLRRTQLLPGESLPSLLERLTGLNHYLYPHTLKHICNERLAAFMGLDDPAYPRRGDTFFELAHLTQLSVEDLFAASRHRFTPALLLPHQSPEQSDWIGNSSKSLLSRMRAQGHLRSDSAAQYCPVCLTSSAYHRLQWIPFATAVCLEHLCLLVVNCPQCQKQLSVREIVGRQCQACRTDLHAAKVTSVAGDELGIQSQQMIQSWLSGNSQVPEALANFGFPESQPVIRYHLLRSLCRWWLDCLDDWPRAPVLSKSLAPPFSGSPRSLPQMHPNQTYALYRAAFTGLLDWPQGLFQFLDIYCGRYAQDPGSAKNRLRLERVHRDWFKSKWSGAEYHFLKRAYVVYLLSRGLPIPVSMAHRFKDADWFVESTGIWTEERTARVLDLPVTDLHRFYSTGSLKECLWSSSINRGSLFKSEQVLAVQNKWRTGWSLSDASSWLGISEQNVVRLVERNVLTLLDGDEKDDPAIWVFGRKTVEDFFQKVVGQLEEFLGEPYHLCRLFEVERWMLSVGIDSARLIQHVAEGALTAYTWPFRNW
jgi:hypothetical protein